MSFRNIKDLLSREEMKNIMAGSGAAVCRTCQGPSGIYQCFVKFETMRCMCINPSWDLVPC